MVSRRFPRGGRGLFFAALLLAGCSTRDHTNPFDPENPDTKGAPRLLTAVAGDRRVDLSWRVDPLEDMTGFRLRRTGPEGTTVLAESLDVGTRSWSDTTVVNETRYDYRLDVRFAERAAPVETPAVPATPGRGWVWLLEGRDGGPVQIAPDGRALIARRGDNAPGRMDLDAASGTLYVVDGGRARVEAYTPAGTRSAELSLPGVLAVAAVPGGNGVWLSARDPGRLLRLTADLGHVLSVDTLDAQFQELAWDDAHGALWGSDVAGERVLHRRADGGITWIEGFVFPFSLAITGEGHAWVTDRGDGSVSRIDAEADTAFFRIPGFRSPLDVVVDADRSGAWVSDGTLGLVVHFSAEGAELDRITGLDRPYGLAYHDALWVTDARRGTLERYDAQGNLEERLTGLFSPFAVAVGFPATPGAPRTR